MEEKFETPADSSTQRDDAATKAQKWILPPKQIRHLLASYPEKYKTELEVFRVQMEVNGTVTSLMTTLKKLAEDLYGVKPMRDEEGDEIKDITAEDFIAAVKDSYDQFQKDRGIGERKALELKLKMLMKRCKELEH